MVLTCRPIRSDPESLRMMEEIVMRMRSLLSMCGVVLAGSLLQVQLVAAESGQSRGEGKTPAQQRSAEKSQGKIQQPQDCDEIKAGTGGGSEEAAAKQECVRSQHLGAGTGTSSGSGSGKMGSGSGPR